MLPFLVSLIQHTMGQLTLRLLSGISLTVSLVCLYYLFKNWKANWAHRVITAFSSIITMWNIASFILRANALRQNIEFIFCLGSSDNFLGTYFTGHSKVDSALKIAFVPAFLWLTDAFLVSNLHFLNLHKQMTLTVALSYLGDLVPKESLRFASCSSIS